MTAPTLLDDHWTTPRKNPLDFDPSAYDTCEAAAKGLHAALVKALPRYDKHQDPAIEMFVHTPEQSRDHIGIARWHVCWEAGPHERAIRLPNRHLEIGRSKSVLERQLLHRLAQEEREKRMCRPPLFFAAPGNVEDVIRVVAPVVEARIGHV